VSKHLVKYKPGLGGEFFNCFISYLKGGTMLANEQMAHLNRWSSAKNGQGHLDVGCFNRYYWPEVYKDNPNMLDYYYDFAHLFPSIYNGSITNGQGRDDQFKVGESVSMHAWNKVIINYAASQGFKKCVVISEHTPSYTLGYSVARHLRDIKVGTDPILLKQLQRVCNCDEPTALRKRAGYGIVARHIAEVYSDTLNNTVLAKKAFNVLDVSYDDLYRSDYKTFKNICAFLDADCSKEQYKIVEEYSAKNDNLIRWALDPMTYITMNHGITSVDEAKLEYTYEKVKNEKDDTNNGDVLRYSTNNA